MKKWVVVPLDSNKYPRKAFIFSDREAAKKLVDMCHPAYFFEGEEVNINKEEIKEMYAKGLANLKWLVNNYKELAKKYKDMFVAVSDCKVVDYDIDPEELLHRLEKKGVDISTVAIDFIIEPESGGE